MLIEKNERIRNKGRETRNKRKMQTAKSFEIKIDKSCPSCGRVQDMDVSAAYATKYEGLSLWNVGETLADDASTSSMLEYLKSIPHVKASIAGEARSPKQTDVAQEAPSVRVG